MFDIDKTIEKLEKSNIVANYRIEKAAEIANWRCYGRPGKSIGYNSGIFNLIQSVEVDKMQIFLAKC
ncbi:hypothetical protein [Halarsenatibacter silvermanii]|uniref:Uncharacterized protein n=1 Tax=Halarsenatibacter silvermanii TaxID=321763 RepID=A0A1G9TRL3_9FIRM|nr:hypothetical protein [Halarsenatibacter silvermanii]SDM50261.1 hypothetical protein SAMN04488692_1457 [Halarsenatibacter silvermanii]